MTGSWRAILLVGLACFALPVFLVGQRKSVHVDSYKRKDGTVVRSYDRSSPESVKGGETNSGGVMVPSVVALTLVDRDPDGRIRRSSAARSAFQREYLCPSTNLPNRSCPGYIIDHLVALACGGPDEPSNMQWQTIAAAALKDKIERVGCGLSSRVSSVDRPYSYAVIVPLTSALPEITLFRITSLPSDADVEVDGTFIGTTPIERLSLSEGSHSVIIRSPGFHLWGGELIFEGGNGFHAVLDRDPSKPQIRR